MDRPDSLLSVVMGWLAAAALGTKVVLDYMRTKGAKRKEDAEIKRMGGEAIAAQIKAEMEREETLFARAERQLEAQDERIGELKAEVSELRAEVRRLNAIEDRAIRDGLAHEREALAWRSREEELVAQLAAAVLRAERAEEG